MKANKCPDRGVGQFFKRRRFLEGVQSCILAPFWTDIIASMRRWGYVELSIYESLRHSFRLAEFAAREGIRDPSVFSDDLVDRYLETLWDRPRTLRDTRIALGHLMAALRDCGVLPPSPPETLADFSSPLAKEYAEFITNHRNISPRTVRLHHDHVVNFLKAFILQDEIREIPSLKASVIFRYVTRRATELTSRHQRKGMCTALRSFLRFLHLKGYIARNLSETVPVIPTFKLARLPRPIDREDIERILIAVDRTSPMGQRDYAMLLVLGTYGIRAGQLSALCLDDIDWRRRTIRVPAAKNGREVRLPLVPDVCKALVDYLRHGRPRTSFREIFLRVRPPIRPLGYVVNVIRKYIRKAGLTNVPTGPHAWRHALASRMLADGRPLKTISDVLGHRSIESTFIYTKIDIEMLRKAALEWPEVQQ